MYIHIYTRIRTHILHTQAQYTCIYAYIHIHTHKYTYTYCWAASLYSPLQSFLNV